MKESFIGLGYRDHKISLESWQLPHRPLKKKAHFNLEFKYCHQTKVGWF